MRAIKTMSINKILTILAVLDTVLLGILTFLINYFN